MPQRQRAGADSAAEAARRIEKGPDRLWPACSVEWAQPAAYDSKPLSALEAWRVEKYLGGVIGAVDWAAPPAVVPARQNASAGMEIDALRRRLDTRRGTVFRLDARRGTVFRLDACRGTVSNF